MGNMIEVNLLPPERRPPEGTSPARLAVILIGVLIPMLGVLMDVQTWMATNAKYVEIEKSEEVVKDLNKEIASRCAEHHARNRTRVDRPAAAVSGEIQDDYGGSAVDDGVHNGVIATRSNPSGRLPALSPVHANSHTTSVACWLTALATLVAVACTGLMPLPLLIAQEPRSVV
jgi:hypothetical protein